MKHRKGKAQASWGNVARWYHETVEGAGSYQKDLILPNLLRLMNVKKGAHILDLGCGEGFFSRRFAKLGAHVIGVDIAPELIALAKKNVEGVKVAYQVASADSVPFVKDASIDATVIVLALQNIENARGAIGEASRVLKKGGKLFIVLNHPAFRIPKESEWGYDDDKGIQYRRVDRYISELKTKIQMHPSAQSGRSPAKDEYTYSFHRPLQFYLKALGKAGCGVVNAEEWVSEKKSEPGPRQEAEDRARKEVPLFLCLEAVKLG